MTVQSNLDINTTPFILYTFPSSRKDNGVLLQDAGRGIVDLEPFTLLAQIAATGKWVPWTDITAVDGTAYPSGIFLPSDIQGAILAADLVAGDVEDVPILVFGAKFDEDKLVIENSLTLETAIEPSDATTIYNLKTAREVLLEKTLIPVETTTASLPQT